MLNAENSRLYKNLVSLRLPFLYTSTNHSQSEVVVIYNRKAVRPYVILNLVDDVLGDAFGFVSKIKLLYVLKLVIIFSFGSQSLSISATQNQKSLFQDVSKERIQQLTLELETIIKEKKEKPGKKDALKSIVFWVPTFYSRFIQGQYHPNLSYNQYAPTPSLFWRCMLGGGLVLQSLQSAAVGMGAALKINSCITVNSEIGTIHIIVGSLAGLLWPYLLMSIKSTNMGFESYEQALKEHEWWLQDYQHAERALNEVKKARHIYLTQCTMFEQCKKKRFTNIEFDFGN